MDAKITKTRLGHYLSYEWVKIVAITLAVLLLWLIIFSATATRIMPSQHYNVFNYQGTIVGSEFEDYDKFVQNKVFSHEVIEGSSKDMTTAGNEISTLMQARTSGHEINALLVADIDSGDDVKLVDENGQKYTPTYLERVAYGYFPGIFAVVGDGKKDGIVDLIEAYINPYFTNGYTDVASIDGQKIERDFRARVTKNKDKRYKKEEQIQAGVQGEIDRIKRYALALAEFKGYLQDGVIALQRKTFCFTDSNGNVSVRTGDYALNLCPDESKMDLKKFVYYWQKKDGEEDKKTCKDVCLLFFMMPEQYDIYLGEHLLYVNQMVRTYKI